MNTCDVYIWEQCIGQLVHVNENIYFKYLPDVSLNISPLKMPPSPQQYSFKGVGFQYGLPGVFYECLPDDFGMEIIDDYFMQIELNYEPSVIDKLLFIGESRLGALKFEPSYASKESPSEIILGAKELYLKAKELIVNKRYDANELLEVFQSFSPLGGARAKALVGYNATNESFYLGRDIIKEGYVPSIIKFDERALGKVTSQTMNEYIMMKCAQSAGIDIPAIYLLHEGEYTHFVIERFDIDSSRERLHRTSVSSLNNFNFRSKLYGYDHIFRTMLFLGLPSLHIEQMYRRMVFNYIFNNHDDHLKNHSLLMNKQGEWFLSPAYDITFLNHAGHINQWLLINGKKSMQVTLKDFDEIAHRYGVKNHKEIIREVESSKETLKELISQYLPHSDLMGEMMLVTSKTLLKG